MSFDCVIIGLWIIYLIRHKFSPIRPFDTFVSKVQEVSTKVKSRLVLILI